MQLLDFYCYIILYLSRFFTILCVIYLFFTEIISDFPASKILQFPPSPKFSPIFPLSSPPELTDFPSRVFYRPSRDRLPHFFAFPIRFYLLFLP